MEIQKFVRKPLYVDAVKVTAENFLDAAFWANGTVKNNDNSPRSGNQVDPENQHIWINVRNPKTPRQTRAYVGDWILSTIYGHKVYTEKAFHMSFDDLVGVDADKAVQAEKKQPLEPLLQRAAVNAGHPVDPTEVFVSVHEQEVTATDPDKEIVIDGGEVKEAVVVDPDVATNPDEHWETLGATDVPTVDPEA